MIKWKLQVYSTYLTMAMQNKNKNLDFSQIQVKLSRHRQIFIHYRSGFERLANEI